MTREEFMKGWILLTAQPWGLRYADNSSAAQTQLALYFHQLQELSATEWGDVCMAWVASGQHWPTLTELRNLRGASFPGVEAAWAHVRACLYDEERSVVWTTEMRIAFGTAWAVKNDKVAAHMAFKETYIEEVTQARARNAKPVWALSAGTNRELRDEAVQDAISKFKLVREQQASVMGQLQQHSHTWAEHPGLKELVERIGGRFLKLPDDNEPNSLK